MSREKSARSEIFDGRDRRRPRGRSSGALPAQLLRKIDTHELTGSGKTRGFARAVVLERRNPIFALEKSP